MAAPGSATFPTDQLYLLVDAIDNRGIPRSDMIPISALEPVNGQWTTSSAVAGVPCAVGVRVSSASSPISHVTLADGARQLSSVVTNGSGSAVTMAAPASTTFTGGVHTLTTTTVLTNGTSFQLTHALTVRSRPAEVFSVPSSGIRGSTISAHASVSVRTKPIVGLALTLESRTSSSLPWTSRAHATTNTSGSAWFRIQTSQIGSAQWRVVSGQTTACTAGTSNITTLRVMDRFTRIPAKWTVRARHKSARYRRPHPIPRRRRDEMANAHPRD